MKMKKGFTLAEVLVTLAIIGVVAAITIPSLMVNVNEKAWDSQRKALHARLANALPQLRTLGGYTDAFTFVTEGLNGVYKITNTCTKEKMASCGISGSLETLDGRSITFPTTLEGLNGLLTDDARDGAGNSRGWNTAANGGVVADTDAAAFETSNGESIAVYYNPNCISDIPQADHYVQSKLCVNFVYDLNGSKGPNKVGKDIGFISALYPKNPVVVAPMPLSTNLASTQQQANAAAACTAFDEDSRLPDRDELASMFYNYNLIGNSDTLPQSGYWSGSVVSSSLAWLMGFDSGSRSRYDRTRSRYVRCLRR